MVKTRQQKRAQAAQQTTSSSATPPSQPPSTAPPPQAPPTHSRPAVTNAVLPSIEVHPSATGGQDSPMSNAAQYGDDIVDYEEMALRELNSPRDSPENAAYARRDQASRQASFESLQRRQDQDLHDDYSPRLPLPEAGVPDGRNARSDDDNRDVPAPARLPFYHTLRSPEEVANLSPVYRRASLVDSEVNYGRAGADINHTQPYDARPQGQYNPEPVYGYQPPPPIRYDAEPAHGYQPAPPVQLPPFGELLVNVDPQYQHLLRQVDAAERSAYLAREEANDQINAAEEYAHDNLVQRQTLQARMHTLEQEHRNAQGLLHDYVANLRQRDVLLHEAREREQALQAQNEERDELLRQAQAREQERDEQLRQERAEAQARQEAAATLERELRRDIRIGNIDNRTLQMTIDHTADVRGLRHAMADHDDQIRGHADQLQQHGQQMGQLDQEMVDVEDRLGNLEEMVHGGRGAFRGRGRQVGDGEGAGPVRHQRVTSRGSPYNRRS